MTIAAISTNKTRLLESLDSAREAIDGGEIDKVYVVGVGKSPMRAWSGDWTSRELIVALMCSVGEEIADMIEGQFEEDA